MLQNIFSHRPPLYDLFYKAELRALPQLWSRIEIIFQRFGEYAEVLTHLHNKSPEV